MHNNELVNTYNIEVINTILITFTVVRNLVILVEFYSGNYAHVGNNCNRGHYRLGGDRSRILSSFWA